MKCRFGWSSTKNSGIPSWMHWKIIWLCCKQNLVKLLKKRKKIFQKIKIRKMREKKELEIIRVYDASRELVFKVWTDPKHLAEWWGPHGFTNPVCEIDARPGGA